MTVYLQCAALPYSSPIADACVSGPKISRLLSAFPITAQKLACCALSAWAYLQAQKALQEMTTVMCMHGK